MYGILSVDYIKNKISIKPCRVITTAVDKKNTSK